MAKAVPLDKLVPQKKQFFAIKSGILYWYEKERARKSKGNIVIKEIEAIEINPQNKLQINFLHKKKIYKLESVDTIYYTEKWFNSIQMIKNIEDTNHLTQDRYRKLKIYNRENAKVTFKEYELLL